MIHGIPRGVRQQVGVAHRHLDGLVPHQGFDPVDVGAGDGQPRSEGMAKV